MSEAAHIRHICHRIRLGHVYFGIDHAGKKYERG